MSVIEKIAYHLGERSEAPNQVLAKELAETEDTVGIKEIADYLYDKNQSIASDCIKVLYEIGYLKPQLITDYTQIFLNLLDSKVNRMVWGAMIALSTVAPLVPEQIYPSLSKIRHYIDKGTVITNVSGVRTLIRIAGCGEPYYSELINEVLQLQKDCRNTDFAKRAEEMVVMLRDSEKPTFKTILEERLPYLSKNAQKRVERVIRKHFTP